MQKVFHLRRASAFVYQRFVQSPGLTDESIFSLGRKCFFARAAGELAADSREELLR